MDAASTDQIVSLRDVSKTYGSGIGRVLALRGIDLDIGHGEFVAVIGPSGSGKTTCANIIGCLDRPTSGRCVVAGQPTGGLDANRLALLRRRAIGFIFQGINLLPRASAQLNVELPLCYRGIDASARAKRAAAALAEVGLGLRATHLPGELSGGQQQRVAIARALVCDPMLIIADEPTGALDSRTGEDILKLLVDLNTKRGVTIVMITHDREAATRAHRIVEFRDGAIVNDGSRALRAADDRRTGEHPEWQVQ